jgi:hypothetical protein
VKLVTQEKQVNAVLEVQPVQQAHQLQKVFQAKTV